MVELDAIQIDVSSLCRSAATNVVLQGQLGTGIEEFTPKIVVVEGDDDCTDAAFSTRALGSSLFLVVPLFLFSVARELF